MSVLPLLLALALTADPRAPPAEPEAEAPGPGTVIAPDDLPAPPAAPAAPFALEGFQAPERVVVGVALRGGGSAAGLEGGVDATARHRGFVAGVSVGGIQDVFHAANLLGLSAGYGLASGLYRGEVLLGWGKISQQVVSTGLSVQTNAGHYRGLQAALERAVVGGEGWRASVGLTLWWRDTFGLAAGSRDATGAAFGGGVRLGVEAGW